MLGGLERPLIFPVGTDTNVVAYELAPQVCEGARTSTVANEVSERDLTCCAARVGLWHSLHMGWSIHGRFTSKPDHCVTALLTHMRLRLKHHHCNATSLGRLRGRVIAVAVIQVGPPFAEHLRTLPGVLVAGKGPIHF